MLFSAAITKMQSSACLSHVVISFVLNSIRCTRYQKDIDSFGKFVYRSPDHHLIPCIVNVIQGALQPFSIPPEETYQGTLGGNAWRAEDSERTVSADGDIVKDKKVLVYQGRNPNQDPTLNLRDSAVTRTVGGMSTHWTANCRKCLIGSSL